MTAQVTEQILELVMEYRCLMPSIGTRKLYWLIKGKLLQHGLKCGRDQLFKILKEKIINRESNSVSAKNNP